MGIRDRLKDRQLRRAGAEVGRMIDDSLKGKPDWAMASRLLGVSFGLAKDQMAESLAADKAGNAEEAADAREKACSLLRDARTHATGIPLPNAPICVDSLTLIEAEFAAGRPPSNEALAHVDAFVREAFC